jgi:NSS family neurotransmitter:Na+ symporter
MEQQTTKRSSFSGKIGFVLAAAGSAVGLGNIWRFPYLAAKYGGGIFLLVYIALAVSFGFVLMMAEIAIGRKTGKSAIGAFEALDKRFTFVGWLAALVPAIILPYYSVIGGWVMKYIFGFVTGDGANMANDAYFGNYTSKVGEPIFWFALFLIITAVVVFFGVEKGIEKVSKIMMPILIAFILFIVIYTLVTLDGAIEGALYYIKPDFSKFSAMTVVAALGQLFYSMSIAMGIMITFGSYMKKDISIEKSVHQVEIFDTGIAFLSGLMIVPAVFAFSGGDEAALGKGASLMFVTLPKIFDTMPGGSIIGAVFFIMVFFAAVTSAISLMETVVSIVMDKSGLSRKVSCLIVFGGAFLLGLPSLLGYSVWSDVLIFGKFQFLDFFDFISNSIIMPVIAIITCIFVGYFIKPKTIIEEAQLEGKPFTVKLFTVMIKYIAPICIMAILVSSILDAFGILKI